MQVAAALGTGVICAATLVPVAGHAAPIDDQRAQAAQLAQQLTDAQARDGALNEQVNGANLKLSTLQQRIAEIQTRLDGAQAQTDELKKLIQQRAQSLYTSSGQGSGINIFDLHNFEDFAAGQKYGELSAARDHQLLAQLRTAQADLSKERGQVQQAEDAAQQERDAVVNTKAQLDANTTHTQQLLAQVNGQIAGLVQQAQQQQLQAAQAAGQQRLGTSQASGSDRGGSRAPSGPPPAVQPGASGAVAFAMAQVGKPYSYAAAGPDAYDCSGLTMASWGAAGVSLPHFSGAQYDDFPHVSMSQLQPGDLVFPSDPGSHVALYAGGGMVVEATHTGDFVHYWPMRSEFVLAARP